MLNMAATIFVVMAFIFGSLFSFSGLYTLVFQRGNSHRTEVDSLKTRFPITCYFSMESDWPDNGTLHPAMNSTLCTHLLFIGSTIADCNLVPTNKEDPSKYYSKIPMLKKQNPALKVLLTNGGDFGQALATAENRSRFVNSSIPFLRKYGFDGLDLDWEFPGWPPDPKAQRQNFTRVVQEFRRAFDAEIISPGQERLLLTAAVAAGRSVMVIYEVPALAQALDYINLMCYDYHGYGAPLNLFTDYNSPLYPKTWRERVVITSGNMAWSANKWHDRGMPKSKIWVGIPTYDHSWKLENAGIHGHHAPATGVGQFDEYGYSVICDFLKRNGTHEVFDTDAAVPYAYNADQWISYDNVDSVQIKAKWIAENGFGGIMVFSLNADDSTAHCDGHTRFPLVSAIVEAAHSATYRNNRRCARCRVLS